MIEGHSASPTDSAISAESWLLVKDLFWELQALAPEARTQRLETHTASAQIRDYAMTLLAASESMGERFDQPAIRSLVGDADPAGILDDGSGATLVGRMLGKYRVVRRIGQGGMGAVYEAHRSDDSYDKRVAIKTLWRGADSSVLLQRFRSERQILAGLEHPNIARLIDGGTTDEGAPFLVMEMVDGVTIDEFCDRHTLGVTARLDLFRQVCAAVQHAHRNLVIHRDLKPSNVLVTPSGSVKLLDFGVAKLIDDPRSAGTLTGAGLSPFTRAYAAPEQIDGGTVSTVTDVYSLGALLFVLLTGKPPFEESGSSAATVRSRSAPLPSTMASDEAAHARGLSGATRLRHVLRGDLDAITLGALREDPTRRYATVDALSEDVHRYLRGERVLATPDTLSYRARAFVRRRRGLVSAAAVVAFALIALSAVALNQTRVSRREAVRSERIAQFLTLMTGSPDTRNRTMLLR
ncbi:MAG: serine/threonine protein kinase, partial [Gemmatimonadota bacterium]|nr:serine/threonine protein kinase [Gemmatimonadota bacterium]